jgi:RimJ/RimL family protein N-acetyltransferase
MTTPLMYGELAPWFHLITAPEDYKPEADWALAQLRRFTAGPLERVLELGSGGGNNALHLKQHVAMTLTDLSPQMLALSQTINPDCEHLQGDMRDLRLDRRFDAVFVHDAVAYLLTEEDLLRAFQTAWEHCRPGAVALFQPDDVLETLAPSHECGGHDAPDGRALRYLEWAIPPQQPGDPVLVHFSYSIYSPGEEIRVVQDLHRCGAFPRAAWLRGLERVGFLPFLLTDDFDREVFAAVRPEARYLPIQPDDLQGLQDLQAWVEARPWPLHGPAAPADPARFAQAWAGEGAASWWIEVNGERVGTARLSDLHDPTALLDLRLDAPWRGRGLGRASAAWLTRAAFLGWPALRRVAAYTRDDNAPMIAALRACGFHPEARHRAAWPDHNGHWRDALGFGILRADWEAGLVHATPHDPE